MFFCAQFHKPIPGQAELVVGVGAAGVGAAVLIGCAASPTPASIGTFAGCAGAAAAGCAAGAVGAGCAAGAVGAGCAGAAGVGCAVAVIGVTGSGAATFHSPGNGANALADFVRPLPNIRLNQFGRLAPLAAASGALLEYSAPGVLKPRLFAIPGFVRIACGRNSSPNVLASSVRACSCSR